MFPYISLSLFFSMIIILSSLLVTSLPFPLFTTNFATDHILKIDGKFVHMFFLLVRYSPKVDYFSISRQIYSLFSYFSIQNISAITGLNDPWSELSFQISFLVLKFGRLRPIFYSVLTGDCYNFSDNRY